VHYHNRAVQQISLNVDRRGWDRREKEWTGEERRGYETTERVRIGKQRKVWDRRADRRERKRIR
jgi:hypothetical protein